MTNQASYDCEISVIIPCYNQAQYVAETIDSVRQQTYHDFRCVIVNDGSTDDSEEVVLRAIDGDSRFLYFKNENHGLSYTRNYGISKTNSKYILCLDSDDKIAPTYIEKAVGYLNDNPDTALYYGRAYQFFEDGTQKLWLLRRFNYPLLLTTNCIYCSNVYRRKDYDRVGGYDENMKRGYEDWDFLIRLLYHNNKVYRTDDFVFYYRKHGYSMISDTSKKDAEIREYIRSKNKAIFEEYATIRHI